ncbi:uncharacterized protein LOC129599025 [Paramacrobiotus metropolitanus]|uniref:uncharacterized protein LOC129599025 n=1 Tax=Paramacrobiotus metropolitanus TaxID=2943436 RepID=UPI0024460C77|nr:uncharacterized protein LOC129599025 [Paramacrobiotus metropolitanus]XP_055353129.1 uncharacterized protein LOC129599025 [Paramacrobiotus metropolitanus]
MKFTSLSCSKFVEILSDFFTAYKSPLSHGRLTRHYLRFSSVFCTVLVMVDFLLDVCDISLNYLKNPLCLSSDEKHLMLSVLLLPFGYAVMQIIKGRFPREQLLKHAYPASLCWWCAHVQRGVREVEVATRSDPNGEHLLQEAPVDAILAAKEANRRLHEILKLEIFGEAMPQLFLRLYFIMRHTLRSGDLPTWLTAIKLIMSSLSICLELYSVQILKDECYCIRKLCELDDSDSNCASPEGRQRAHKILLDNELRPYRHNIVKCIVIVTLSLIYCLIQTTIWALVLNSSSTLFHLCLALHGGLFWALKFYFALPEEVPWSEHPMPVLASLRYIFSPYCPQLHVEIVKENSSVARQHYTFLCCSAVVSAAMQLCGLIVLPSSDHVFPPGSWINNTYFIILSPLGTLVLFLGIAELYVQVEFRFRPPETTQVAANPESENLSTKPSTSGDISETDLAAPGNSGNLQRQAFNGEAAPPAVDIEMGICTDSSDGSNQSWEQYKEPTVEQTEGYNSDDESHEGSSNGEPEKAQPLREADRDLSGTAAQPPNIPIEHGPQGLAESLRKRHLIGRQTSTS